eukprot:1114265-Prymnesium_polylepis.1
MRNLSACASVRVCDNPNRAYCKRVNCLAGVACPSATDYSFDLFTPLGPSFVELEGSFRLYAFSADPVRCACDVQHLIPI